MAAPAPVSAVDFTMEEMERRVARFRSLKSSSKAFIDTRIAGHERDIFSIIGASTFEDPDMRPAIPAQEVHMGIVRCEPGKGAALHSHLTEEIFMPLSGTWSVFWGPNGAGNVTLETWDVISVPIHVMRGFRNVGTETAHILAIVGGREPGKVGWPDTTLTAAGRAGFRLTEEGKLVEA